MWRRLWTIYFLRQLLCHFITSHFFFFFSSHLHLPCSSISLVTPLTPLLCLLLIALVPQPSTCNPDAEAEAKDQVDALSVQLSVTAQVTPTPLWAVVWGPTQPLEDETYHILSSQETDPLHPHGNQLQEVNTAGSEEWSFLDRSMRPGEETPVESRKKGGVRSGGTEAEGTEPEEGGRPQGAAAAAAVGV